MPYYTGVLGTVFEYSAGSSIILVSLFSNQYFGCYIYFRTTKYNEVRDEKLIKNVLKIRKIDWFCLPRERKQTTLVETTIVMICVDVHRSYYTRSLYPFFSSLFVLFLFCGRFCFLFFFLSSVGFSSFPWWCASVRSRCVCVRDHEQVFNKEPE